MDLKCIEAVEQVAAEFSLLDLLLNVDIGGGNDPHINRDHIGAADPAYLLFLKDTQQLGLKGYWNFTDLV